MARYRTRATHDQRGGNPGNMLSCPVTCFPGDGFGRDVHTAGQPNPVASPDEAVKLSPRHPRSRKLRRSHHPR
jgi:hypothetical protein